MISRIVAVGVTAVLLSALPVLFIIFVFPGAPVSVPDLADQPGALIYGDCFDLVAVPRGGDDGYYISIAGSPARPVPGLNVALTALCPELYR